MPNTVTLKNGSSMDKARFNEIKAIIDNLRSMPISPVQEGNGPLLVVKMICKANNPDFQFSEQVKNGLREYQLANEDGSLKKDVLDYINDFAQMNSCDISIRSNSADDNEHLSVRSESPSPQPSATNIKSSSKNSKQHCCNVM